MKPSTELETKKLKLEREISTLKFIENLIKKVAPEHAAYILEEADFYYEYYPNGSIILLFPEANEEGGGQDVLKVALELSKEAGCYVDGTYSAEKGKRAAIRLLGIKDNLTAES